jgi:hypothetical protein
MPTSARSQPASLDPEKIVAQVEAGFVRVEMDLQFDRGEPPAGVMDHDPGSHMRPIHSLADVIEQERPLETTGFLVAPRTVVAMDPGIHPRFIRSIHVRTATGETRAQVQSYGLDTWMMVLRLEEVLPNTTPIRFTTGKAALTASAYRAEGVMYTELLPFSSRYQKPMGGSWQRVAEHQGVALTQEGEAVGMVLSRRLALDASWQGSPLQWATLTDLEYQERLTQLKEHVDATCLRVRLSFRSPSVPTGDPRASMRFSMNENEDENATEMDVTGIVTDDQQVLVLASLKPKTTARLERIAIIQQDGTAVPARFVASLRDFGALIVAPEKPLSSALVLNQAPLVQWTEKLLLRANLQLQGEQRTLDLFHGRIATLHVGPRLEPYPELIDMSDANRTFLFSTDLKLVAFPMSRRASPAVQERGYRPGPDVDLVPAELLSRVLNDLAAQADLANVPVSEENENQLAWLGAELQPLTRELARANGVADQTQDGESGALVTYVHPNSPASDAKIQPGAILLRVTTPRLPAPIEVSLDDEMMQMQSFPWDRLDEVPDQFYDRLPTPWASVGNPLVKALTALGFDTPCTLYFFQNNEIQSHNFRIQPGPAHYESAERLKLETLGLTLRNLTYEVRRYTQTLADDPGVVIARIEQGSRASIAGLKPFEIISHVNDIPVHSVKDIEAQMADGKELKLNVRRMAKGRIVTLRP